MYQLEETGSGRYDVRAENGIRAGSIIGGERKWCAEIGNRVVGYYPTTGEAAEAILKDRGIVGVYQQMAEIIKSTKLLQRAHFADFATSDRRIIEEYGCATNHLWVVHPTGTHLVQLGLPLSQREGEAVLNAFHPDFTGKPWNLYLIDAITLKVLPLVEAQARQWVAQRPQYLIEGTNLTAHGTPIATISRTPFQGLGAVGRRCHIRIDCAVDPSTQRLAVIKRLAFYAGIPCGSDNAFGTAATVEVRFGGKKLYSWEAK